MGLRDEKKKRLHDRSTLLDAGASDAAVTASSPNALQKDQRSSEPSSISEMPLPA